MTTIAPIERIPENPRPPAVPGLWNAIYDQIDDRLARLNMGKQEAFDLSALLTAAAAAATYLTPSQGDTRYAPASMLASSLTTASAAGTYLTIAAAAAYLTQAQGDTRYALASAAGSNLTTEGAAGTYLTIAAAAAYVETSIFTGSNKSLTNNGYQKLPGGLIIQWGYGSFVGASDASQNCSFPIAFPTNSLIVIGSIGVVLDDQTFGFEPVSATQFKVGYHSGSMPSTLGTLYSWVAIGH